MCSKAPETPQPLHSSASSHPRFCPQTGIYTSRHPPIPLPQSPFLDVVSHLFSYPHNGASPALVDSSSGCSLSYSQLRQMVGSVSSGLSSLGVAQGDVVLILLPNSVFFPVCFLGILSLGAVATTMNPLSSAAEIKKQVDECRVGVVFAEEENVGRVESLMMNLKVITVPRGDSVEFREFDCYGKLFSGRGGAVPRPVIRQDDSAVILFSSGTSGASKGVVLSHANLIATLEAFVRFEAFLHAERFPIEENVYLAVVPMFHVYGLAQYALGLLSLGTKIVVMRKFSVEEMLDAIDRYGVTHLPIVPPILMALVKAKARDGRSLSSLKQVSCGAAPCSKKILQDFVENFPHVDFIQGYGMTESILGTRGWNTGKFKKYTSAGLLAPNTQAKVVDVNTGACLPPGRSGELWLRGPGVMKGYLNQPDSKSGVDKDGWLHTGDIVYFDQDGYLYLVDRLKEMIKYKGFQIAPADLEGTLISHPEIHDAAITGLEDDEAGEIPVAFVVRKPGSALSEKDVISYVASQVAPHKKVRMVVFTPSIPKSAAGKILRRQLKSTLCSRI